MSKIERIDSESVHRICSGQVVLDLATAVKELVENAIDANATQIEVRLRNHGADLIEVIDNGHGVAPDAFAALCLKHYTSKLRHFDDLASVKSLGFRGEALSSLCALAHLAVVTRTASFDAASRIEYDQNGVIHSQTAAAREIGTTVELRNLFHSLPVRLQEFHRSIKREYHKLLTVLQAYAVISTGVRITVSHVTSNGAKSTVLATNARGTTLADNIADVFGAKCCSLLQLFELPIDDVSRIDGFVSRAIHSTGRSAGDRQFFFINRRPVDLPRFARTANDAYRLLNKKQYPMLFLNISLPTDAYDVNVTPNKREIMLHTERQLLDALKVALDAIYQPNELTMVVGDTAAAASAPPSTKRRRKRANDDSDDQQDDEEDGDDIAIDGVSDDDADFASRARASTSGGSQSTQSLTAAPRRSPPSSPVHTAQPPSINKKRPGSLSALDDLLNGAEFATPDSATSSVKRRRQLVRRQSAPTRANDNDDDDDDDNSPPSSPFVAPQQPRSPQPPPVFVSDAEIAIASSDVVGIAGDDFDIDVGSTDELLARFRRRSRPASAGALPSDTTTAAVATAATVTAEGMSFFSKIAADSDADCCRELVRVFRKNHFAEMRVVGQFNLGFIIARLGKDVFIVDQHATDEKFNYERLAASTVLQTQRLIAPLRLELTAQEEDIVIDNMPLFEMNGFAFVVQPDAPPRQRVRLVGRPFSKATEFGVADIQEMIFMLGERPGEPCRPSRVGAMLAMRACRSSVMIGTALTHAAMLNIVTRMADMTAPWSCPHGRPTMRHLFDRTRLPVPPARSRDVVIES